MCFKVEGFEILVDGEGLAIRFFIFGMIVFIGVGGRVRNFATGVSGDPGIDRLVGVFSPTGVRVPSERFSACKDAGDINHGNSCKSSPKLGMSV